MEHIWVLVLPFVKFSMNASKKDVTLLILKQYLGASQVLLQIALLAQTLGGHLLYLQVIYPQLQKLLKHKFFMLNCSRRDILRRAIAILRYRKVTWYFHLPTIIIQQGQLDLIIDLWGLFLYWPGSQMSPLNLNYTPLNLSTLPSIMATSGTIILLCLY